MNPASLFLLLQPLLLVGGILLYCQGHSVRRSMKRRAAELTQRFPDAEQISEVFPLRSNWSAGKQRELAARIAQMQDQGWTYLRTTAVSPFVSLRHWGGAVRLHFILAR